jgi:hypothetical protein
MAALCIMAAIAGVPLTVDCKSANAPPGHRSESESSIQKSKWEEGGSPATGPLAVRPAALNAATDKIAGQATTAAELVAIAIVYVVYNGVECCREVHVR